MVEAVEAIGALFASAEVQSAQANSAPNVSTTSTKPLAPVADLRKAVETHERDLLEAALNNHRHNQRATAKALNLSYDQLRHTMRRHGMLGG